MTLKSKTKSLARIVRKAITGRREVEMNNLSSSTHSDDEENSNFGSDSEAMHQFNSTIETRRITSGSELTPATSSGLSYHEELMRRRLQFFFMNPIEKWKARRKFPYKFVVQVSSFYYFFVVCDIYLVCQD